jgi:hypothetical protein
VFFIFIFFLIIKQVPMYDMFHLALFVLYEVFSLVLSEIIKLVVKMCV